MDVPQFISSSIHWTWLFKVVSRFGQLWGVGGNAINFSICKFSFLLDRYFDACFPPSPIFKMHYFIFLVRQPYLLNLEYITDSIFLQKALGFPWTFLELMASVVILLWNNSLYLIMLCFWRLALWPVKCQDRDNFMCVWKKFESGSWYVHCSLYMYIIWLALLYFMGFFFMFLLAFQRGILYKNIPPRIPPWSWFLSFSWYFHQFLEFPSIS